MKRALVIAFLFALGCGTRASESATSTTIVQSETPRSTPQGPTTNTSQAVGSDSDGDGLLAESDLCPGDAEDMDGFQDEDGCPDLDNDGDQISDMDDRCPMIPETLDGQLDEDGCPDGPVHQQVVPPTS